jgi:hypothetical protein
MNIAPGAMLGFIEINQQILTNNKYNKQYCIQIYRI